MIRRAALTGLFLLQACAPSQDEDPALGDGSAGPAPAALVEALAGTLERATTLADSVEDILQPVPLMTPGDEEALRRYLNASHVASARELGVRVRTGEHLDSLVRAGTFVLLEDSTEHWIVRTRGERETFVHAHARALLAEIGGRFQRRLGEMGLPPYRIEITSTVRTAAQQAGLRRRNANAAAGTSSHEFGTTVDISYAAFAPPRALPAELLGDAPPALRPLLERVAAVTLESVSARKSRELQAILGDVLRQAQAEGIVRVIYERQQPVYHVTVARALAQ